MGTAAGKAAVTVCKLQGRRRGEEEERGGGGGGGRGGRRMLWDLRSIRFDRYLLDDRDVWGVEWEPGRGRRLLPCLSPGPLIVVDIEARRMLHYPVMLTSDCFAACWGGSSSSSSGREEGVFLGLRNGEVRMVDLRGPGMTQPLTTMGCVVDQLEVLPNGRGLLVSDRLGALRLLDLRFTPPAATTTAAAGTAAHAARHGTMTAATTRRRRTTTAYLRDFPPTSTTPASTGFVVDPVDSSLLLTLTTQGQLRAYNLSAPQSEEEEEGRRARVSVIGSVPSSPYSVASTAADGAATAGAAAAPPRFFLARRWGGGGGGGAGAGGGGREGGSEGGRESKVVDVWPTLVCGDRLSGRIQQLCLQRERPPSVGP